MSAVTEASQSIMTTDNPKNHTIAVQNRSEPDSFHINNPPETTVGPCDLTVILRIPSEKEFTLIDRKLVVPVRESKAVKAAMAAAQISSVGHLTVDHISVSGPESEGYDIREYGPMYPLVDHYETFDPSHVENTTLIGRDPEDGRVRFLTSESKDDSDGQHIYVGNVVADTSAKRRHHMRPIHYMAAKTLITADKTKTNRTITIVDPAGLRRHSGPEEGADLSWELATRQSQESMAWILDFWGWPTTRDDDVTRDDELVQAVKDRVRYLTSEESVITLDAGKRVTTYLEEDGNLSRYEHLP